MTVGGSPQQRSGGGLTTLLVVVGVVVGLVVATVTTVGIASVAFGWDTSSTTSSATPGADGGAALAGAAAPSEVSTPTPSPSAVTPTVSTTPSPTATPSPTRTPSPSVSPKPAPSKPSAPASSGLVAVVGVVDGDTIKVSVGGVTERVRVIGIDTPELRTKECYAQQASSKMQSLVQSKKVRLVRDPSQANRDRYDRLLRHVQLTDGRQVAKVLIAGGYGEEYTYDKAYAGQASYRAAERAAREAGKGIWSSGCLKPPPAAPGKCLIKGNISSSGEKIYHLPGQQFYEVTIIDESKGERWFCSESDAVAAGWRKSKR